MRSKVISWGVIVMVALIGVTVYTMTRLEVTESHYSTYEELASIPNIFDAGWIPSWTPKSAVDIVESHDVDTNEGWLVFKYLKSDEFYAGCKEIPSDKVERPNKQYTSKFPQFVTDAVIQISRNTTIKFYSCDNNSNRYLAIDKQNQRAYVWIKTKGRAAEQGR